MGMKDRPAPWLEFLDHTADVGIRVRAASLGELFERAAWGMMSLVTDPAAAEARDPETIEVEADDRGALMVRWLSEVNRLHQVRHRVFGRFQVERVCDTRLTGHCVGESIDFSRHEVFGEIKAVTFHRLRVDCREGVWTAEVLFDV
jgi:SHS2 domain-containing protein